MMTKQKVLPPTPFHAVIRLVGFAFINGWYVHIPESVLQKTKQTPQDPAENNNPCFICREPSKGFFVPNFSIDQLAEMHFKNKLNMDDKEREEYQQWLSRAQ